jgi:hypothetical protein
MHSSFSSPPPRRKTEEDLEDKGNIAKILQYINGVSEEHYGPSDESKILYSFDNFALENK